MNDRIRYLKKWVRKQTADIDVFLKLEEETAKFVSKGSMEQKTVFLETFSEKIPVIMDENELLVGSLRFWKGLGWNSGHQIVDYRMILEKGIPGILEACEDKRTEDLVYFERSVKAFRGYIKRYSDTAYRYFEENQKESWRKIHENCKSILDNPPKTFAQALQLIWFVHLFLHAEGMSAAVSFGRVDQYLYSYYARDLEAGILTRDQAKELLACFWLKTCEGEESQNLTVGGEGENDLTLMCLEVTKELNVHQPSISVRIGENTSEAVWNRLLDVIRLGSGMPAIFNDKVVEQSLINAGISAEDAKDYGIVGCYEANPDGKALGVTATGGTLYLHEVLLAFLKEGKASYQNFEGWNRDFVDYFTDYYKKRVLPKYQKHWEHIKKEMASPFQGACMGSCLESGLAAEHGGAKYTMFGVCVLGIGTLVDSIYAIRELVFRQEKFSYDFFRDQVMKGFPDRNIAELCKKMPGKYGTDFGETNEMAAEWSERIAKLVLANTVEEHVITYPGLFVFLHDVYSEKYPATPDGRLEGERISYGIAASDFCQGKTATSLLNSASHIANDLCPNGNPVMLFLNKSETEGERGSQVLKTLIRSYFEQGGFHLQINLTDAEVLREAQKEPEKHADLLIRVSGYSAYFTGLDATLQNALIERAKE